MVPYASMIHENILVLSFFNDGDLLGICFCVKLLLKFPSKVVVLNSFGFMRTLAWQLGNTISIKNLRSLARICSSSKTHSERLRHPSGYIGESNPSWHLSLTNGCRGSTRVDNTFSLFHVGIHKQETVDTSYHRQGAKAFIFSQNMQ